VPTTTTRSRVRRSAGLVIAPLMLLGLAACGDDDGGGGDSTGGSTESFCDGIKDIAAQVEEFDAAGDDASPEEVLDQVGQLVERMQALDPPAEIEDDWNQSMEVLDNLADGDLEGAQETTDEQDAAGERVSTFLTDECGVDEGFFGP